MNAEAVDCRAEMLEAVQLGFVLAPIVLGSPVLGQFPQIGEIGAVFPSGVGHLIRKARAVEALTQILQDLVAYVDGERFNIRLSHRQPPQHVSGEWFRRDMPCSVLLQANAFRRQ